MCFITFLLLLSMYVMEVSIYSILIVEVSRQMYVFPLAD